ncbi:MAG: hypothetical protein ACLFQA_09760 [Bacteroidales bacterium]
MEYIKKIAVYLTTALLFVATTNIVLTAHICAGELYQFSLYEDDISCGCTDGSSDQDDNSGHSGNLTLSGNSSCCSEITLEKEALDVVYPTYNKKVNPVQISCLQLINCNHNNSQYSEDLLITVFKSYSPPTTDRDIPVLVQSFLL